MAVLVAPIAFALAETAREVPEAAPGQLYEPKTDGWRIAAFTGSGVLQTRGERDVAARFPEIAAAARPLGDVVLDGELVGLRAGQLDFTALAAPPRARARAGVVVYIVVFDLLAVGGDDLRAAPLRERRARLVELLTGAAPPVQLCPQTTDRDAALAWMDPAAAAVGVEGVMTKAGNSPYRAGRSRAWRKTRQKSWVDLLVVGVTGNPARPEAAVLALPHTDHQDQGGGGERARAVGISLPLPAGMRAQLGALLVDVGPARLLPPVIGGLPGRGPGTTYRPVAPTVLVEVEADPSIEHGRFRHRPRVHRIVHPTP